MGDLERIFTGDIAKRAVKIGNELALCYEDALAAIQIATANRIAILGFDSGELLKDGFQVVDYSGYDRDISFNGDWKGYVAAMNADAETWIKRRQFAKNHVYVLTSTSEEEFAQLRNSEAR